MDSCKAVVFKAINVVEYADIPFPKVERPTDAILKVLICAICGSDLHPLHGKEACAFETAFGHECVGEVISVGAEVKGIEVGSSYIVPFSIACGKCFHCENNLSSRCKHSQLLGWRDPESKAGLHGGQAEYVRVPQAEGSLYPLPLTLSLEEGLLLADIAATAAFCAVNAGLCGNSSGNTVSNLQHLIETDLLKVRRSEGQIPVDSKVYVIVGCGPVGLLTLAMARAILYLQGYVSITIFAVDTVDARLSFAENWGATPLKLDLSSSKSSSGSRGCLTQANINDIILAKSKELNRSGEGADAVMECVGSSSALSLAYDVVAPGGTLSSVGVHSGQFPFTPSQAYDKNITYRSGRCPARSLMKSTEFLLQYAKDSLNINMADVITHKFPLAEAKQAYEVFDKKQDGCLKAVLYPKTV
eukprot:CAMPEP_0204867036 /NCGR_PEP_ID=MMETSP1348-20121228/20780_1 /ASSEMBLY_ACC=CAM_ASM_000700 /TAXON_ID=215587 /ORGANISM="Aplanochytrium stocchinoi, Strain GSBS06" /LENGTH=415 /DNA_ID=CAMNT_0052019261 /DNA_START=57 /DNA_END=1304 /DNA_ORIENTATION=-